MVYHKVSIIILSATGHEAGEEDVQVYQEGVQEGNTMYLSRHTQGPAGAFDGTPILAPYPPLEQLQQKRLAARRHKTTFAYDFPNVFGNALRKIWVDRDASGECDGPLPGVMLSPPSTPNMVQNSLSNQEVSKAAIIGLL